MSELPRYKEPPKVSVVMPAYNAAPFLRQAVDSILAQTLTNFELIVIDDGSMDSTFSILESYSDPRMRVIRKEKNEGIILALNSGIAHARGEYLARMDADDIALPQRLDRQVDWLDNHPNIGVVGTRALRIDTAGRIIEPMISITEARDVRRYLDAGITSIIHSSVMMRIQIMQRLGGYRDDFQYAEDLDLWLRVIEISEICNLNEKLMLYRSNPDGIRLSKISEAARSSMYAYDCYRRRTSGLGERTRAEFIRDTNVTRYETDCIWSLCVELFLLGETQKSQSLLRKVLRTGRQCASSRLMALVFDYHLSATASSFYRLYRLMRGWVTDSPLGRWASHLKHYAVLHGS